MLDNSWDGQAVSHLMRKQTHTKPFLCFYGHIAVMLSRTASLCRIPPDGPSAQGLHLKLECLICPSGCPHRDLNTFHHFLSQSFLLFWINGVWHKNLQTWQSGTFLEKNKPRPSSPRRLHVYQPSNVFPIHVRLKKETIGHSVASAW